MQFILGLICGLIIAVIVMLTTKRLQTPIERVAKNLENFTKERGEVFVDEDDKLELEHFLDNLPKE